MKKSFGFCILIFGFGLAGCGSETSPEPISFSETPGDVGYIQLSLSNASNPNVSEIGTLTHYKVRLEGKGFEPIEQTVSAEAKGALIQGIPVGKNRNIYVQALNNREQILREGLLENIAIQKGKTNLEIALQSVPVVLNLESNRSVSNQGLHFDILTDPGHHLLVQGALQKEMTADEQGLARFSPDPLPAGYYQFTILDQDSNKSNVLSLRLFEGAENTKEVL